MVTGFRNFGPDFFCCCRYKTGANPKKRVDLYYMQLRSMVFDYKSVFSLEKNALDFEIFLPMARKSALEKVLKDM